MDRTGPVVLALLLAHALPLSAQTITANPTSTPPGISDYAKLVSKAEADGVVPVIVRLATDFLPEGTLGSAQAIAEQRAAIAGARNDLLDRLSSHDVRGVKTYDSIAYLAVRVDATALNALISDPEVDSIEQDVLSPPSLIDTVPMVGADVTAALGFSGLAQTVAILDTGVDAGHPFLGGKVVDEACFSSDNQNISRTLCPDGTEQQIGPGAGADCNPVIAGCNHGTHVAGIAAGRGGPGFDGVARDADIMSIQVFSEILSVTDCWPRPAPCTGSYTSDQISALQRVYDLRNTYDIAAVNLSLGGGRHTSPCYYGAEKAIIDNLRSAGIVTVISSGNNGFTDAVSSPACISTAISVGATTKWDGVWNDSNTADFLDLLAPGFFVQSSIPAGLYGFMSGTSMAAPHVTGAFAILKSADPQASVETMLRALKATGQPIDDTRPATTITKPRIQIDAALNALPFPWIVEMGLLTSGNACGGYGIVGARVTFNEPIDPATFSAADVVLTKPDVSPAFVARVYAVAGSENRQFDISIPISADFPASWGAYALLVGPDVEDDDGNRLDLDADAIGGEMGDDQYAYAFSVRPPHPRSIDCYGLGELLANIIDVHEFDYYLAAQVRVPVPDYFQHLVFDRYVSVVYEFADLSIPSPDYLGYVGDRLLRIGGNLLR